MKNKFKNTSDMALISILMRCAKSHEATGVKKEILMRMRERYNNPGPNAITNHLIKELGPIIFDLEKHNFVNAPAAMRQAIGRAQRGLSPTETKGISDEYSLAESLLENLRAVRLKLCGHNKIPHESLVKVLEYLDIAYSDGKTFLIQHCSKEKTGC